MRKTRLMIEKERSHGSTLEDLIRSRIEAGRTWEEISQDLKVSRPTLFTWMCRLGGEIVSRRSVKFASEEEVAVR